MMKLVQMLQMLIMRSLNASCGICGFANDFGIFESLAAVRQTPPVARSKATNTETVWDGFPLAFE